MYNADGNTSVDMSTTSKGIKLTVKYAEVKDNYGSTDWHFWVLINTTFTVE